MWFQLVSPCFNATSLFSTVFKHVWPLAWCVSNSFLPRPQRSPSVTWQRALRQVLWPTLTKKPTATHSNLCDSLWKLTKLKKLAALASSPVQPATQRSVCSQPAIKFYMALYHRVSYHLQIYTISECVLMYIVLDATAFARLSTPEWPPSNCSDIVWTKLGHSRRVKRVASCHVVWCHMQVLSVTS